MPHCKSAYRILVIVPLLIATVIALGQPMVVKSDQVTLPLQKVLEASNNALQQKDYDRLKQLLPYFEPVLEAYQEKNKVNIKAELAAAILQGSMSDTQELMEKIAFFDLTLQFNFPEDANPELLQDRLKLAYLDYHYILSGPILAKDVVAENRIRGMFHKAYLVPRSEYPSKIIQEISRLITPQKTMRQADDTVTG